MFSREYLFQQCNLQNHCLRLLLKEPLRCGDKQVEDFYLLEIITNDDEKKEFLSSVFSENPINTQGSIRVKGFMSGINRTLIGDEVECVIDTHNIIQIEMYDGH